MRGHPKDHKERETEGRRKRNETVKEEEEGEKEERGEARGKEDGLVAQQSACLSRLQL